MGIVKIFRVSHSNNTRKRVLNYEEIDRVGKTGVGEMGVGKMGQIIGETGVGEMGVGEMGVILASYLSGRRQRVVINGQSSDWGFIDAGVP